MMNRLIPPRLGAAVLATVALLGAGAPGRAAEPSLKGDAVTVDDATAHPIDLDVKALLPCLTWADDKGTAFVACDADGVLRLISYPGFEVKKKKDFERKVAWIARTKEGLLLTMPDPQGAWLLDPDSWEVKKKIAVTALKRAVGAPASSFGAAFGGDQVNSRLYLLDLKAGKAVPFIAPDTVRVIDLGNFDPVMTPDGKYVFARGLENVVRYAVVGGKLKYQETSPRIQQGAIGAGIQVSPDSKYVCHPSGGGNYGVRYGTYVYPVTNVKKAEFTVESGPYPQALGFDPAGGWVYAQNIDKNLMLFTFTGIKKKEYKIGGGQGVKQFLPHPDGGKLLLFTDAKLWAVEVPKKK